MEAHKPSFTIFIPTYNSQKYIRECIESAIKQDYENKRIVVLDSGSNDETISIIKKYDSYACIEIILAEKRLSIFENWDRIKEFALTDWITILGHDDILAKDFLSEMAVLINSNPESNLFTSHFDMIDGEGQFIRSCHSIKFKESASEFLGDRLLGKRDSFATGYVIKTSEYLLKGGIPNFPDLLFSDDALWLMLSLEKPMVCSPKSLFKYRFHSKSTSGTPNQINLMTSAIMYLELARKLATPRNKLSETIEHYGIVQMIHLSRGYIGLEALRKSYLNLLVGSEELELIQKMSQLLNIKNDILLDDIKVKFLLFMNRSFFRRFIARCICYFLPIYKYKAGIRG